MTQLELKLFESETNVPSDCRYELEIVEMGDSPKSYCELMSCWTTCRAWGSCVYELWKGGAHEEVEDDPDM